MSKNPATKSKLIKILSDFIDEERDAFRKYTKLASLLEEYGFTKSTVRMVVEIAKQEEKHFYLLSDILEAIL